jgi:hypothetical protein
MSARAYVLWLAMLIVTAIAPVASAQPRLPAPMNLPGAGSQQRALPAPFAIPVPLPSQQQTTA